MTTLSIWNDFSERLHGFITSKVSDDRLAEDLLQEVFVKVHTKIDTLKNKDKLQSWVFAIARNVINDHYRTAYTDSADEEVKAVWYGEGETLVEDALDCLVPFIRQLPDKYRIAIEMSELQGYTQQQVADHLGISLSGAKSRVQRGRAMLKQKFVDCCNIHIRKEGTRYSDRSMDACDICS